jgi:hypothetical protein
MTLLLVFTWAYPSGVLASEYLAAARAEQATAVFLFPVHRPVATSVRTAGQQPYP